MLLLSLVQMEQENQQLKVANLKQTEQILLLQDKLQGEGSARAQSHTFSSYLFTRFRLFLLADMSPFVCCNVSRRVSLIFHLWPAALLEKPASSGSPASSPAADAHLVPSSPLFPPSCPGTPPAQDEGWRQPCSRSAKALPPGSLPLSYCPGL